ncbi:MAG: hypothetical protein OEM02_02155 [Desulfobulbaceae bacterium]|nr:hypothetical protein [Desulfobulbaceae bacterium]
MRQYLIDEISYLEHDNIDSYLKRCLKIGPIEGVYWLKLPPDMLGPDQVGHENCGPFYFSIVLEKDSLRFEFLIRSANNMHCTCISWATPTQRQFLMDFADKLLLDEMIRA